MEKPLADRIPGVEQGRLNNMQVDGGKEGTK